MGEFFRSWRRKIGVVMLLMACVTMGGWVRSASVSDTFSIGSNSYILFESASYIQIESAWRHLIVSINTVTGINGKLSELVPFWMSDDLQDGKTASSEDAECFGTGSGKYRAFSMEISYWKIKFPYWSIVSPLTFLSAWLLLSKPRQSTQKKIDEPVAVEGT